jgi:hypothetical protein
MSTCRLARETRKQTFERVIANDLEVGGGHLLAPGFARVERTGTVYRIVLSPSTFDPANSFWVRD